MKNDPEETLEPSGSHKERAAMRIMELALSHKEGPIEIPYGKLQIHSTSWDIMDSVDETELHNIYTAMAMYIRNAMRPEIRKMKRGVAPYDKWEEEEIEDFIERYKNINRQIKTCDLVGVSCTPNNLAGKFKYEFQGRTAVRVVSDKPTKDDDDEKTTYGPESPLKVAVLSENAEFGYKMALNNELSKNNCSARAIFDEAQGMAFELGIVSIDDAIVIDIGSPTRDDVKRRMEERRRVSPADEEP
ncbi:MAG: hypothetical protein PHG80_10435 [Methanoregulaceae archaeon]|nr:hypothetical protein [Methanoregulaceae archaeon]